MSSSDEHDREGIWVYSDLTADGQSNYTVTVSADPDTVFSLKADAAMRYVAAVFRAATVAQHDAAVIHQLSTKLGLDKKMAAMTIVDLRDDREPAAVEATAPLRFEAIVSNTTGRPYVHVSTRKKQLTQWTPEDCFHHGSAVLQVLAGVDLDSAYFRYLVNTVGIDAPRARAVVNDLGNCDFGLRDDDPQDPSKGKR